jgi:hypothetical protein
MMQLIHMTATYSNAMLVAILPHVSDCAKQLDLPIAQPITTSQVAHFGASPYKNYIAGGIWLTNHYWFVFNNGFMSGFRSPDNWFTQQEIDNLGRFVGKDNMTTNEAIELARDSFRKLGYEPKDFHVDGLPTEIRGPYDNKKLGHIPFCEVDWNSPEAKSQEEFNQGYTIRFDIDMQRKQVTGMTLMSKRFFRPDPKVDIVPELESDYRKQHQMHIFVRTNAPPRFSQDKLIPLEVGNHLEVSQTNSTTATNSSSASPPPGGQEMKQE